MQDKLMTQLKKLSFMTVHPDADWLRIFVSALILLAASAGWNAYLYFNIQSGLAALDDQSTVTAVHSGGVDEIKATVAGYDKKSQRYTELLNSKAVSLPDPSSS